MPDIQELLLRIAGDSSSAQEAARQLAAALGETGKAVEDAGGKADNAHEGFQNLFGHFAEHVAAGVLLRDAVRELLDVLKEAIEALPELVKHTIEAGNQLFEMAIKTGASVENLSRLKYAAVATGMSFESLNAMFFRMQMMLAATGPQADHVSDELAKIGLSMGQLQAMKSDDAFITIISHLESVKERAVQSQVAFTLFGRGVRDATGLMQGDIKKLMQASDDLGITVDANQAAAAKAADMGWKVLEMRMDAVGQRIGNAFVPALVGLSKDLGDTLTWALNQANSGLDSMGKQGGFLQTVAAAMGNGATATAAQAKLYEELKDTVINFVRYGIEPTITAIRAIMNVFEEFKILALDVKIGYEGLADVVMRVYETLTSISEKFTSTSFVSALGAISPAAALAVQSFKSLETQTGITSKTIATAREELEQTMELDVGAANAMTKTQENWTATSKKMVADIEAALVHLKGTHTDVVGVIKERLDELAKANQAMGGQADDLNSRSAKIADVLTKLWDKAAQAWATADQTGLNATLASIDAKEKAEIDAVTKELTLKKAGQDQIDEAIAAIQNEHDGQRYVARQKSEQGIQAELRKLHEEGLKAWADADEKGLQAHLDKLNAQEDAERAASFIAMAQKQASTTEIEQAQTEIHNKYEGERHKATVDSELKNAETLRTIWADYATQEDQLSADSVAKQLERNRRTFDDKIQKLRDEGRWSQELNDAEEADAKKHAEVIIATNDPIFKAWKNLNADLRQTWADTWAKALDTHHGFVDALMDPWKQMEQRWIKVLGAMVADWESQFLSKLSKKIPGMPGAGNGGEYNQDGSWVGPGGGYDENGNKDNGAAIQGGMAAANIAMSFIPTSDPNNPDQVATAGGYAKAGAQYGEIAGPYGMVVGAIIGAIVGAMKDSRAKDELATIGSDWGVSITESLALKMQNEIDNGTFKSEVAAAIGHLGEIITAAGGLNTSNLSMFEGRFRDMFVMIESGQMTVAQGTKVLDENWKAFAAAGTDALGVLDAKLVDIIKLNDKFGTQSKEITAYLAQQGQAAQTAFGTAIQIGSDAYDAQAKDEQALADLKAKLSGQEVQDLAKIEDLKKQYANADDAHRGAIQQQINDLIGAQDSTLAQIEAVNRDLKTQQGIIAATGLHSQAAASALGAAVAAMFNEEIKSGKTFMEALHDIGPDITNLPKELDKAGYDGGKAFDALKSEADLASDAIAGPALSAVDALSKGMIALGNMGMLDQTTFEGLGEQIEQTFESLVKQGKDGGQVMIAMQPSLQALWEEQQKFGYTLDDSTQALVDEAVASGLVGENHKSATDQMIDSLKTLHGDLQDIVSVLTGGGPKSVLGAFQDLGTKAKAAIESIPKTYDLDVNMRPKFLPGDDPSNGGPPSNAAARGGYVTGGGVEYLGIGGVVGGPSGTDTVPAWLTPGEMVLSRPEVAKLYAIIRSSRPGALGLAGGADDASGASSAGNVYITVEGNVTTENDLLRFIETGLASTTRGRRQVSLRR